MLIYWFNWNQIKLFWYVMFKIDNKFPTKFVSIVKNINASYFIVSLRINLFFCQQALCKVKCLVIKSYRQNKNMIHLIQNMYFFNFNKEEKCQFENRRAWKFSFLQLMYENKLFLFIWISHLPNLWELDSISLISGNGKMKYIMCLVSASNGT